VSASPGVLARSAVCVIIAAAGATAAVFMAGDASAHESDCHAQQTCPSDDGGYVWTDSSGQGWTCGLAPNGRADGTLIVFDGQRYACEAVTPEPPPPPAVPPPTAPTPTQPSPTPTVSTPPPAKKPKAKPRATKEPARPSPQPSTDREPVPSPPVGGFGSPSSAAPTLAGGPYVFPVFGPAGFVDTFGAPRATVSWHHGADIFAPAGSPILAVASGTLFSVGWNDIGGKRLWLRDREGNEFYFAHLSEFSPIAGEGARVAAGEVLGYVGTTGDAEGTPPHLHFEIHPLSMLGLGYDGAVNPTGYLESWRHLTDLSTVGASAPRPGAVLLAVSDISTASGLDRGSLGRAFNGQPAREAVSAVVDVKLGAHDTRWTSAELSAAEADLERKAIGFARTSSRLFGSRVWDALASCEASGTWDTDSGNGYAGGLQFAPDTWLGFGGAAYARSAAAATREQQIEVAEIVLAAQGWKAWPTCSRLLGLQR
jgi:hypothetical protein